MNIIITLPASVVPDGTTVIHGANSHIITRGTIHRSPHPDDPRYRYIWGPLLPPLNQTRATTRINADDHVTINGDLLLIIYLLQAVHRRALRSVYPSQQPSPDTQPTDHPTDDPARLSAQDQAVVKALAASMAIS